MRGSQRNAIHKNRTAFLNPSLGFKLEPISKQARPVNKQRDKRRGGGREGEGERGGKRERGWTVQHIVGDGEVTRQERMDDLPHLWSYKPANGSGGSSPGTAPGTLHRNTPHHVTTALHRILTANQHYSTATQLRLVHKRYTRKRVRVIGKQL